MKRTARNRVAGRSEKEDNSRKMKFFGSKADGVIDGLLRAEFRQQALLRHDDCAGFDPDMATSYLEGVLSGTEAARYQSHLAECVPCRTTVTELRLLEGAHQISSSDAPRRDQFSTRGSFLALFTYPRLALAATAVLIIAFSALWVGKQYRMGALNETEVQLATERPSASSEPIFDRREQTDEQRTKKADRFINAPAEGGQPELDALVARQNETAPPAAEPKAKDAEVLVSEQPRLDQQSKDQQLKKEVEANEVARDAGGERATQSPSPRQQSQTAAGQTQAPSDLGRIDQRRALSISIEGSSTESHVIKQPHLSDRPAQEREKAGAIQPDNSIAKKVDPPASVSGPKRTIAGASPAGGSPGSSSEDKRPATDTRRARAAEPMANFRETAQRKSGGKTFRLINGVWTDKNYNPDKEIPHISMDWDSDIYNEQLAKHPGLKSLLAGFSANQKVIVVYKKMVFRIMPADQERR